MLTLGSLFDGIGGWQLAAVHAGVKPIWSSEIEKFPLAVTRKRFPDTKQLGDVTKITDVEPVDIVCAGSPCQDLSIAGKREGLAGERSGLFINAINIVRQMRMSTGGRQPRFFIWENVPGAFTSGSERGADFRAVLESITETDIPMPKDGRWANAGMVQCPKCEIAWRTLDAQFWGVPQRRKRIFLVADFAATDRRAGKILFVEPSLSGNTEQSRETRKRTAAGTESGVGGANGSIVYSFDALASNSMKSKNPHSGCHITNIAKTLDTSIPDPSKNQGGIAIYDMTHANEVIRTVNGDKANTLNARMGTGGNQVPILLSAGFKGEQSASARGLGYKEEQCPTLTTAKTPDVMTVVRQQYAVRRLTPLECERLQGLPDGWTLINDKSCSDSARYKAIGNGMAQPCADYVIQRIVDEVGKTYV